MGAPLDDCFYFTTVADLILGNIYSWQFLSSEKSLARKKVIYLKDFTDLNFFLSFLFFFFLHFVWQMPVCLASYAKCVLYPEQPTVLLTGWQHNDFEQFWKFKFHFEHFPRNTLCLSFDGPSHYLYVFKNHQQTFSWPGERPSSHLKFTQMWFGPSSKYLSEPLF